MCPQPVEDGRVGTRHVHDLHPACRPRDQRHRLPADAERLGYRGQRRRGGPPVHGARAHPHHQGAAVFAAHAGTCGPRAHPDRKTHPSSVRPVPWRAPGCRPTARPVPREVVRGTGAGADVGRLAARPTARAIRFRWRRRRKSDGTRQRYGRPSAGHTVAPLAGAAPARGRFAENHVTGAPRRARVCREMRLTGGRQPAEISDPPRVRPPRRQVKAWPRRSSA